MAGAVGYSRPRRSKALKPKGFYAKLNTISLPTERRSDVKGPTWRPNEIFDVEVSFFFGGGLF